MTETLNPGLEAKRDQVRRLFAGAPAGDDPHPFATRVNPRVAAMLHGLGLDVDYVHGSGTTLTDADGRQYLDFAGAYGALPFGHNPPAIWRAVAAMRDSGEPSLVQPSLLSAAGQLGEQLCQLAPAGLDQAWFCNSGAEAVEAALKLVRGARPDRTWVVATHNGFHGKTLGALSVTGRPAYHRPFGAPAAGFAHVPYGDLDAAEAFVASHPGDVAAFVVEPIQGEGGIHPAPRGYLAGLRRLCDDSGALLVVDEVQTGLGRTGTLFAVEHDGVRPDVMPLAKALGGGLVPVGAVVFGSHVASEAFALRHTSTFGANAFCARVGLATLATLTHDDHALLDHVTARGDQLAAGLARIVADHAPVAVAARGRGLLWGLELADDPAAFSSQGLFRSLADAEGLVAAACGHLLRVHGIRVAPTFFSGRVLRIEPPLTVSADEVDRALEAIRSTLAVMLRGDSATFFAHLMDPAAPRTVTLDSARRAPAVAPGHAPVHASVPATTPAEPPRPGETRWAFLAHPTDPASYASFDRRLDLPGGTVKKLFDRLNRCRNVESPAAMLLGTARVVTDDGTSTYGEVFALGHDARALLDMPRRQAVGLVRRGVVEAVDRGAQVVGLGAYTSIVTDNGELLGDVGALVTTGNAFTVASAVDALTRLGGRRHDVAHATCGVVGAAGNIGQACALLLAERCGRLVLGGNPATPQRSRSRLRQVAEDVVAHLVERGTDGHSGDLARRVGELARSGSGIPELTDRLLGAGLVRVATGIGAILGTAPLVVVATSTPESVVAPHLPLPGAVLCDVSQPPNIGPEVALRRPDVDVVPGGLVEMPAGRDLGVDFGLAPGVTYACTAETLVAAARLDDPVLSRGGRLDLDAVRVVGDQARELGFRLHVTQGGSL